MLKAPKRFRELDTDLQNKKKLTKNQIIGGAFMMIIALTFIFIIIFQEDYKTRIIGNEFDAVLKYNSQSALISYTDETGTHENKWFSNELITGYNWINSTTPLDSNILCWWDYGHGIKGYAERNPIIRNPSDQILHTIGSPELITEFDSHIDILAIAQMFSSKNSSDIQSTMVQYNASFIMVGSLDIYRAAAIFNISGLNYNDYLIIQNNSPTDFSEIGKQTNLYKMIHNIDTMLNIAYEDEVMRIYEI